MRRDLLAACAGVRAVWSSELPKADKLLLVYSAVYCCGYAGRGSLEPFRALARSVFEPAFAMTLSSCSDAEVVDAGWRVLDVRDGSVVVERDGFRVRAPSSSCVSRARLPVATPSADDVVSLRAPAVGWGGVGGFVTRAGTSFPPAPLTRLYVNLTRPFATWALSTLGDALDRASIPYQLKVAAHPAAYRRRDACVVYVGTDTLDAALCVLTDRIAGDAVRLGRGIPVLTGRHRRDLGIGIADEPDDVSSRGESFGLWVARLLGTAVAETADADVPIIAKRVCTLIEEAGRDPERPHLRAAFGESHATEAT